MRIELLFRNGARVEADVDDVTTERHRVTNALASASWNTPPDWTAKLQWVDLSEILAVVVKRDPS